MTVLVAKKKDLKLKNGGKMEISKEVREELKALSLKVYGRSSKWKKLLDKPFFEVVTKAVHEEVANEDGTFTPKTTNVPILLNGVKQSVAKRRTIHQVRELLIAQAAQIDAINEQFKKNQEEQKAKKEAEVLQNKIHKQLSGSAV